MKKINKFTTFAKRLSKEWNTDTPTEIDIPSYVEEERLEREEAIEKEIEEIENNENMRHIKLYEDFESSEKRENEKTIELDNDEMESFENDPVLKELISNGKISLYSNILSFDENDQDTKDILDNYGFKNF